ncbi:hypothetical protein Tco_0654640 [Tanacetum coccineum]|uniref:BED-type domain-containing protein n=1 Tax=Tanacetum coccineum TaxID=301880 RepID=A0ABQ4X3V1_9ASTR
MSDGTTKAQCKLCFQFLSSGSNSTLKAHINNKYCETLKSVPEAGQSAQDGGNFMYNPDVVRPSHSPSWKEDSFEINVLLEESETEGTSARSSGAARDEAGPPRQDYINQSFEASMRNRILRLEQDDSPYLLGKAKGTYWSDIRLMLEHALSQNEYNRLLEFENALLII